MISQDKTAPQIDELKPAPGAKSRSRRPLWAALGWFVVFGLCLSGLIATALLDLLFNYGVSYGTALDRVAQVSPAQLGANPVGVSTLLHFETDPNSPNIDRTLDLVKAGGFGFIRQLLPWEQIEKQPGVYDWALFDKLVEKAQVRGIQVLFRLDRPPPWSRLRQMEGWTEQQKLELTGPPDNYDDFYNFVSRVTERYKGRVKYYQIWNEPNLTREWNGKRVDAPRYVELLKGAYQRLKAADPTAIVLSAPLSPTDEQDTTIALNDLVYLNQMYKAGAKDYFDILGLQIYGLGYAPDFRYIQPDFKSKDLKRVNFNRPASIREIMIRNGDGPKPAWAAEYGWVAIPTDRPVALKENQWGSNIDEETQATYLVEGIKRARKEWPWLGVMTVWFFRADPDLSAKPDRPENYFSIVRPDYQPRPAYLALQKYNAEKSATAYTGWHPAAANPAVQVSGSGVMRFQFEGERAELVLKSSANTISFKARLDGQSEHDFSATAGQRLKLGEGLTDTAHVAEINGLDINQIEGFYVSRDNHFAWLIVLALAVCGLGVLVSGAFLTRLMAVGIGWLVPVAVVAGRRTFWPSRAKWTPFAMIGALLLYYYAPVPLAIAGVALFFPLCFVRPDWAIGLAALASPLFLHPRNLRPGGRLEFTITEVIIVELTAAFVVMLLWRTFAPSPAGYSVRTLKSAIVKRGLALFGSKSQLLNPLIWPVLALLTLATFSLLVPEPYHLKEALREYRLVIVEPVALFILALVYLRRQGSAGVLRLVDFLVVAGTAVALVGIYQFGFPAKNVDASTLTPSEAGCIVSTEGVKRICSVYSHPDNLGLFLGRIIPLAASIVLLYSQGRISWRWPFARRQWYGAALLVMVVGLVLSYSRGAWIGVAVALLVMFIAARARKFLIGYGVVLLFGLAALPFIKLERIANIFNFVSGSSSTRLYLWQSAIEIIKDHPLTGLGLDQFLYYYNPQYVNPLAWTERFTSHPHNLVLDFWLRLGILGPLLLGVLLFSFFRANLSRRLRKPAWLQGQAGLRRVLALGLLGSMVDFIVHGLVDNSFFVIDLAIVFCLSFAMLEILRNEAVNKTENLDSSEPASK